MAKQGLSRIRYFSELGAAGALGVGIATSGISYLKLPFSPNIRFFTSVNLCLLSLALILRQRVSPQSWSMLVARFLAFGVTTVGFLSVSEYFVGWNFQNEFSFFNHYSFANQMTFQSALSGFALGFILSLKKSKTSKGFNEKWAEAVCSAICFLNFTSSVGSLFGIRRLYGLFSSSVTPLSTSFSYMVLASAILLSFEEGELVQILLSNQLGGVLFRRYLPGVLLFPFGLGLVKFFGERLEIFDPDFGLAVSIMLGLGFLLALAWSSTRLLERVDKERSGLKSELSDMNAQLNDQVKVRTHDIEDARIFLDSLLEGIPNIVYVKKFEDLSYVRFNKAAEEFFGYSRQEMLGKRSYDFFPKKLADEFEAADREVFSSRSSVEVREQTIRTRNKGTRVLHTTKVPIFDLEGNPRYLLGISEDITDLKNALRAMAEQQNAMIAGAKMAEIGLIAGGIAQEINSPLASIQLEAGLIKANSLESTFKTQDLGESIVRIEKNTSQIAKVVSDLRALAGSIGGASKVWKTETLQNILDLALGLCRQRVLNLGVQVKVVGDFEGQTIECFPEEISQAIFNIIHNSLDALAASPEKALTIEMKDEQDQVEISITDSGAGILPETRDKIFNPFFSTKEIGKGTGLGLSVAKGIIERHEGKIRLLPTTRYTSFVICLPKKQRKGVDNLHAQAS